MFDCGIYWNSVKPIWRLESGSSAQCYACSYNTGFHIKRIRRDSTVSTNNIIQFPMNIALTGASLISWLQILIWIIILPSYLYYSVQQSSPIYNCNLFCSHTGLLFLQILRQKGYLFNCMIDYVFFCQCRICQIYKSKTNTLRIATIEYGLVLPLIGTNSHGSGYNVNV